MTPNPLVLAAALLALAGPATAEVYLARCKMGECIHYEQSGRRVEAQGSAAVPGELVRVRLRQAVSASPDTRTAQLQWGAPSEVRFFCSTARPAYRLEDGGFQGLDLGQVFGATEMVSTMYLRACHPSVPGGTIEAALQSLGYRPTPDRTYPSFEALIR